MLDAPHQKRYHYAFDVRFYKFKTLDKLKARLFSTLEQEFIFLADRSQAQSPQWAGGAYTLEFGSWGEVTPHIGLY